MTKTPPPSSPAALKRMQAARQRDTKAEIELRRLLHAKGLRFRVDMAVIEGLRGRADIVFSSARVAVFVDGCFWHCCPVHGTLPKANAEWWAAKLAANHQRDLEINRRLSEDGWHVERVWEHEIAAEAADRIAAIVRKRRLDRLGKKQLSGKPAAVPERR